MKIRPHLPVPPHVVQVQLQLMEAHLPRYNRSIVRDMQAYCTGADLRVLDFGAGIGTLPQLWRDMRGETPLCIEIEAAQRCLIQERGFFCHTELGEVPPASQDYIYSSNVLEHIEDDLDILRQLHDKLVPGGTLALYVPALGILWSGLDVAAGHRRRYSRRQLAHKLRQAGFTVVYTGYRDSLGFFASLLVKWLGYDTKNGLGSEASLIFYDRFVFPLSRMLDGCGISHVLGKNMLAVARKR
ncbi:MAG: class I SAM-dependent methyltransferase [Alphaproteobacteria bacterium]|nr:class I SAM-dependent methyltransferase [Alphaproteobacteria bacterium]